MEAVLALEDVRKAYENHVAVDGVSFSVPQGCIFGLLGPNGAGKTSLIRIVTTITKADSGQVFLNGEKLNSTHPSKIGYMPEERGLYKKMKVGEHLIYLARLKGMSPSAAKESIQHWMDKFGIQDWWSKKIEELSKGMQQKIQFIATVCHNPPLLILDEPFSGLDPINTNLIKEEIENLKNAGTSIIFSTHRMEQVEEVCERIVLINAGKKVLEGEVEEVKNQFKEHKYQIEYDGGIPNNVLEDYELIDQQDHSFIVQLKEERESNYLLKKLIDSGTHVKSFKEILPTLNEIFIKQVDYKPS